MSSDGKITGHLYKAVIARSRQQALFFFSLCHNEFALPPTSVQCDSPSESQVGLRGQRAHKELRHSVVLSGSHRCVFVHAVELTVLRQFAHISIVAYNYGNPLW